MFPGLRPAFVTGGLEGGRENPQEEARMGGKKEIDTCCGSARL